MPETTAPMIAITSVEVGASKSLGTSSRPASRITGVASRKEKRAASAWLSRAPIPATIAIPDREMPGISANACAAPISVA